MKAVTKKANGSKRVIEDVSDASDDDSDESEQNLTTMLKAKQNGHKA
jgi:hypothetical protein